MTAGARLRRAAPAIAALAIALGAVPASAQVYKCVDRAGRTSYQQQPCPDTHKGGRVELWLGNANTGTGEDRDREWAARAKDKTVVPGMPRAFVVQAYGTPQEMRPGRAGEEATEVWVYRRSDLDTRVGFKGGVVAWVGDQPPEAPPPENAAPATRQSLAAGASCARLESDLGPSQSAVPERDDALGRDLVRYTWLPKEGDNVHLIVYCDRGVVARVDRTPGS